MVIYLQRVVCGMFAADKRRASANKQIADAFCQPLRGQDYVKQSARSPGTRLNASLSVGTRDPALLGAHCVRRMSGTSDLNERLWSAT